MPRSSIKEFLDAIMSLHPSRSDHSPYIRLLFPRVLVKRLSDETILRHTGMHNRFESSLTESDIYDNKLPETPSESDDGNDVSPLLGDSTSFALSDLPDLSSANTQSGVSEQRTDEEPQEFIELDTGSSSSDDDLPDLSDPAWEKEMKEKKSFKRKIKNDTMPKGGTKLMKHARKAFQHEVNRYVSSKEFMKSKAKEALAAELKSSCSEGSYLSHANSDVSDDTLSTALQSLGNWASSSDIRKSPEKTVNETKNISNSKKLPTESEVERKLKEDFDNHPCPPEPLSVSESVPCSREQPSNDVAQQSSQSEDWEDSNDSDVSTSTVLFDYNEIKEIYAPDSYVAKTGELTTDVRDPATFADENNSSKKRKDSPLISGESNETSKKQRLEESQDTADVIFITDEQVESTMSIRISNTVSLSTNLSPELHEQSPSEEGGGCADSSFVPIETNNAAQLRKKGTSETSPKKNEESLLHSSDPLAIRMETDLGSGSVIDTQQMVPYSSHTSENDCILIDSNLSQENSFATAQSSRVDNEKQSTTCSKGRITNRIKEIVTGSNVKETEDMQKSSSCIKESPCNTKSLKQLSLHFHELTTQREQCEDKIRKVKEEYNRKLEALEEQKKNFDSKINKVIAAMSEWRGLSDEEEIVSGEQSEPAVVDACASADSAMPLVPKNTPLTVATSSWESKAGERSSINVIPAASIKNFGKKENTKTSPTKVMPRMFIPIQPRFNVVEAGTDSPILQEPQNLRLIRKVQMPGSSISPSNSSGNCSTSGNLPASDALQLSSFQKQPPPNAVVIPGQEHPVVTSLASQHVMCHPPPLPTNRTAQRRGQVARVMPNSNPGSAQAGYRNPVSSQILPGRHPSQPKKQQQKKQQQQQSNSQSWTQQQCQSVQGPLQRNASLLQGTLVGVTSPGNEKTITSPPNRMIVAHSQHGKSTFTTIPQTNYIVSAVNPAHLRNNPQSGNLVTANAVIDPSLLSVSHATTTAATANIHDVSLPAPPSTQAPLVNRGVNQPVTIAVPVTTVYAARGPQHGNENDKKPICVVCGSSGIFTCCNNIIYCSTICQGDDWLNHKHKCTNTSQKSS